jgi:hypothetical protein
MFFPRFKSKKAWQDNAQREWVPAGRLPAFEELNDFTGTPWYILDHQSDFPSEEQVVEIFRKDSRKKVKLLSFLSWSTNGFKCLVLISEV